MRSYIHLGPSMRIWMIFIFKMDLFIILMHCVPIGESIRLIREAHTLKIARHFGVENTLYNLKGIYIVQRYKIKLLST